ncbi:MAG: hypothetical protein AAGI17_03920 [Planctomycetota bacterium]
MQGQAPSAEFLIGMCAALGVSANWLLTGHGPMRASEIRKDALRQADAGELLTAMSETMTALLDRVSRLERYMQTIETRLRAQADSAIEAKSEKSGAAGDRGEGRSPTNDDDVRDRARRISGAAAKRSSPDDD